MPKSCRIWGCNSRFPSHFSDFINWDLGGGARDPTCRYQHLNITLGLCHDWPLIDIIRQTKLREMANFATFIAVFPKIASLKLSPPPYKNSCLLAFSCSLWSWQQSIRIIKARRGALSEGGSVVCMTQTQSFRYGIELCTGLCTVVCTALYTTIFEMLSAPLLQDLGLNFGGGGAVTRNRNFRF